MPVIPATWEMRIRSSWFEACLGKRERPYLKNKLKVKMTREHGSSGKPQVQTSVPPKKEKNRDYL
jgi:hypothetical protein